MNARRVRAFVAAHSLAHVTERRVVVAVGAEGIALKITDTDATILMQIDRERVVLKIYRHARYKLNENVIHVDLRIQKHQLNLEISSDVLH